MLFKKLIDIFGFDVNNDIWHILGTVGDLCNCCFHEISLRSYISQFVCNNNIKNIAKFQRKRRKCFYSEEGLALHRNTIRYR